MHDLDQIVVNNDQAPVKVNRLRVRGKEAPQHGIDDRDISVRDRQIEVNNADRRMLRPIELLSEISIEGDDHPLLLSRQADDLMIRWVAET